MPYSDFRLKKEKTLHNSDFLVYLVFGFSFSVAPFIAGTIFIVQSQERATKLRADLAVEEHRGVELSRILKEVLPDPKAPKEQKSRPGRKVGLFGTSANYLLYFLL